MKFKKMAVAVMSAAMLAGCGNASTNSGTGDIKAPKFGFIGPLTGDASQYGTAVKNALELAVKKYNKENGTKITIKAYDDKADATEAVNAYNKLVDDDKVTAVLSPVQVLQLRMRQRVKEHQFFHLLVQEIVLL